MADQFPYDIHKNPTFLGMMAFLDMVWRIARNEQKLGLAGGGTGIGKTFHTRRICRKCGIKEVPEERPANLDALVSFFWLHRNCPVVMLDECDHLLRQQSTCNLLKVANGEPRLVTHGAKLSMQNEQWLAEGSGRYREYIPRTKFPLGDNERQVLLSNLNYQDPEVTATLPQEHWSALVGRGIDPLWIPTDGNDGRDLFEYTHHTATEGNMLRSLQFTWEVSRRAIEFYVANIHRLVDIHPRRLVFIAQVFRDTSDRDKQMSRLNQMLRDSDQRPRLIIPATWVPALYLPRRPPATQHRPRPRPKQHARPKPSAPPPKAANEPKPDPEPSPTARAPVPEPEFAPDPIAALAVVTEPQHIVPMPQQEPPPALPAVLLLPAPSSPPEPEAKLDYGEAVRLIRNMDAEARTCGAVMDVLERLALEKCDVEELQEIASDLEDCAAWYDEQVQAICHTFVQHADGPLLFCTKTEVLVWEGSVAQLQIYGWDRVRALMAPKLEEERRKAYADQRREKVQALLKNRLPPKMKLKTVKQRIARIDELLARPHPPHTARVVEHIRTLKADDPRFAECATLQQYLDTVLKCFGDNPDDPKTVC